MSIPALPSPLKVRVGDRSTLVSFLNLSEVFLSAPAASLFVFDENTRPLFPEVPGATLVLPPGEEEKHFGSVQKILSAAVKANLGRDALFYGVGGGVIGDMTAFSASIYMRGCAVKLVPTTLLSMVDASLGGKTGVDFAGYKNMAGTFYPAEEVIVCPEVLRTLPEREYLSGLAEVIKHALLSRSEWLERLEKERDAVLSRDPVLLPELIRASLAVKAEVVEEDFREQGVRAHLNLGHTFGHALESVSGFSAWSHGEGVAWGILRALKAGVLMGITDSAYAEGVEHLLASYGFRLSAPEHSPADLMAAMGQDKKKKGGKVRFILQKGWGETLLSEIPEEILKKVLEASS